jgi:predicted glycosyltransferase
MLQQNQTSVTESYFAENSVPVVRKKIRRKIWIDLENSPHIPFFVPIIDRLKELGCEIIITARDCFQVCELADMAGLTYRKIGHHYGKHRLAKVYGLGYRVYQLAPYIKAEKPDLSISHGSRSLILLSSLLKIPNLTIMDYEHADQRLIGWFGSTDLKWTMTPEVVPSATFERAGTSRGHVLQYPGIKEDVYVPFFRPDPGFRSKLGFSSSDLIVTIRPPATEAHYHNPQSEQLLKTLFEMIRHRPEVKAVVLPRTPRQEAELRSQEPDLFNSGRVIVPKHAVDGLDLIWCSDLVVSGGGTMNREAAALGVPVYSLFRGTLGAVDAYLSRCGKLVLLKDDQDVRDHLRIVRRPMRVKSQSEEHATLDSIVNQVTNILERKG